MGRGGSAGPAGVGGTAQGAVKAVRREKRHGGGMRGLASRECVCVCVRVCVIPPVVAVCGTWGVVTRAEPGERDGRGDGGGDVKRAGSVARVAVRRVSSLSAPAPPPPGPITRPNTHTRSHPNPHHGALPAAAAPSHWPPADRPVPGGGGRQCGRLSARRGGRPRAVAGGPGLGGDPGLAGARPGRAAGG